MMSNEFHRQVSVDFAPSGSICTWCGKPAERKLTAIGGSLHNEGGLFCHVCGDQFTQNVMSTIATSALIQKQIQQQV